MNIKKILFIALAGILSSQSNIDSSNIRNHKYVIGSWHAGFGSAFLAVLNHLDHCNKTNKTPVVYWGPESFYYNKEGFNGSHNVWEYYFNPTSNLHYAIKDRINMSYGVNNHQHFYYNLISPAKRKEAAALIKKYIKINTPVLNKIDAFFAQNMAGKKTIGIHIRGTDKIREEKPVEPEQMVLEALKYADNNTQFLIASDEQKLLNRIIELLPKNKSIYYDCYRSDDGKPLHIHRKPSFAQLGEDILVEISLLSKCDIFIHTASNVSSVALYFNPDLPNILVS